MQSHEADMRQATSSVRALDEALAVISATYLHPVTAMRWLLGEQNSKTNKLNRERYDRSSPNKRFGRLQAIYDTHVASIEQQENEYDLLKEYAASDTLHQVEDDGWEVMALDRTSKIPILPDDKYAEYQLSDLERGLLMNNVGKINSMIDDLTRTIQSKITEWRLGQTDRVSLRAFDSPSKREDIRRDLMSNPSEHIKEFGEGVLGDIYREYIPREGKESSIDSTVSVLRFENGSERSGEYREFFVLPTFKTKRARQHFAEAERLYETENIDTLTAQVCAQVENHHDHVSDELHAAINKEVKSYMTKIISKEKNMREKQGRSGQGTLSSTTIMATPIDNAQGESNGDNTFFLEWQLPNAYFANLPTPVDLTFYDPTGPRSDQAVGGNVRVRESSFVRRKRTLLDPGYTSEDEMESRATYIYPKDRKEPSPISFDQTADLSQDAQDSDSSLISWNQQPQGVVPSAAEDGGSDDEILFGSTPIFTTGNESPASDSSGYGSEAEIDFR